ncbi:bifunctional glycosyl transferase/transpeptidase, partial [Enterobacter hormaechei]|nr:bifunctional glycosyl transferase/transpeptidase [Enterobacter hormaechei]
DGREVVITWVGRDNNQPTKLYGASGAMSIYQRYLANQSPVPLNLVAPEDIVDMGVDSSGNFICGGGVRTLPVWTTNPDALCQQSQPEEPTGNPFDQSSQPQQPQQQQPQQQEEKKDSDGVAGWIKDMFGGN